MLKPEKKWCVGDRKFNTELEAQAYADDENAIAETVEYLGNTIYGSYTFFGTRDEAKNLARDILELFSVTVRTP